jgi:hypothetical protein
MSQYGPWIIGKWHYTYYSGADMFISREYDNDTFGHFHKIDKKMKSIFSTIFKANEFDEEIPAL